MKQQIDNYEPYGPEWQKEMMKLPKKIIVKMFAEFAQSAKTEIERLKPEKEF